MNNYMKNYVNQSLKKFKKEKVYMRLKDNILAADIAKIRSLDSKNNNIKYLLCVIDVSNEYAWFNPLQHKKDVTIFNAFIKWEIILIINQVKYGLIMEDNFTVNVCKNGWTIIIF